MNKTLVLIVLSIFSVLTYARSTAPLGGTLIDKNLDVTIEYTHFDGSVITKYSTSNDWYLKNRSNDTKSELLKFVKTSEPITIVYSNTNGEEFASMDLQKWVRYESSSQITSDVENEDSFKNFKIIQLPENPVSNEFLIKFNLTNAANVQFQIINSQGIVEKSHNHSMSAGLNKIELDISNLSSGAYFYKILVENEVLNKKFLKIK